MKINVKVVVNECCSWKWRLLCSISAVNSWGENNNRLTACACVCMCLCVRACVRASVCVWALSQIRASTSAAAVGARVHRSAANSGLFLFCLFFCWGFFFFFLSSHFSVIVDETSERSSEGEAAPRTSPEPLMDTSWGDTKVRLTRSLRRFLPTRLREIREDGALNGPPSFWWVTFCHFAQVLEILFTLNGRLKVLLKQYVKR